MAHCKTLQCNNPTEVWNDFCPACYMAFKQSDPQNSSGGNNDYWLTNIANPKRLDPYIAECEDIIEALEMSFQEGEAFKAIWRKCADRLGNGKPGDTPLRNAQKVAHFGQRMEAIEQRKLECTPSPD